MHASSHSRWAPHLYFLVKQRVPCSRVGRRGGSFPVLALYSVLFITSEWLLFVPFYFTLIIPTLIASSSRIFFPRLHFRTLISSLSLSAILQFTTYWFVCGSPYCWVCLGFSVLDIDICGHFRNGQVTSYINSYIWWAVCESVNPLLFHKTLNFVKYIGVVDELLSLGIWVCVV